MLAHSGYAAHYLDLSVTTSDGVVAFCLDGLLSLQLLEKRLDLFVIK